MRIAFVGGGTLGPVTPLIACSQALKRQRPDAEAVWIGTPDGPERTLVEQAGIRFASLPAVKWPRYPSWRWCVFPFAWARARRQARRLVLDLKPDVIVSAGGFTAVPVVFAARRQGIPCIAHQLDARPGLANRLIARHCQSVSTSFDYETPPFGKNVRSRCIPTPCRFSLTALPSRRTASRAFGLDPDRPSVLIFGGGSGAQALNDLVAHEVDAWLAWTQIIHVTGLGKNPRHPPDKKKRGYVGREFLSADMLSAYIAADIVIARAGMGALSEIAALKKAAILVPIPGSHQEKNAARFADARAAIVVAQTRPDFAAALGDAVTGLLDSPEKRQRLGLNASRALPTDDGRALAECILGVLH